MRYPSIRVLLCAVVLIFLPAASVFAEEKPKEGGVPEAEIKKQETEAYKACRAQDYTKVFQIFKGLQDGGVAVMERVAGRQLLAQALNGVLALTEADKRLEALQGFLDSGLKTRDDWVWEVEWCLTKDRCLLKKDLDKVEGTALRVLSAYRDSLKGLKGETTEERQKIADLGKYRDLLGLAYHTQGNYDKKKNIFLAGAKRVFAMKFTDMTRAAGLDGHKGVRVTLADVDGDRKEDIVLDGHVVLRNGGKGKFEDISSKIGLPEDGRGCLCADITNSRSVDLVWFGSTACRMFKGDGLGKYTEVEDAGIVETPNTVGGLAMADFNGDGRLDLYVSRATKSGRGNEPITGGTLDHLYFGDGEGKFKDASSKAGLRLIPPQLGWGVSVADFDNDGDADIYVCNYSSLYDKNFLLRNDGKGSFKDEAEARNARGAPKAYGGNTYHGHSYGAVFGDVDNDGDLDAFVANLCQARYIDVVGPAWLLLNKGSGDSFGFEDRFAGSGIGFHASLVDCSFADFDNDGDIDLYLTPTGEANQSYFYRNEGGGKFVDVTWQTRTEAFNTYGHAWFDYDKDGDLDLVVAGREGLRLLKNNASKRMGWIQLELSGRKSNYSAVGARVTVRAGGKTQIREVVCGRGSACQDSLIVHFGLGKFKGKAGVDIHWPSGTVQTLTLEAGKRHLIMER
jgi:hypothetical protein